MKLSDVKESLVEKRAWKHPLKSYRIWPIS